MKKVLLVIATVLVFGFGYLYIAGSTPQTIRTEIEIMAPPSEVWPVITKIEEWQNWSPIISSSSGEARVGAELNITMSGQEPNEIGPTYQPKIVEMKEPLFFKWRAHMMAPLIFTNDKIFELKPTQSGTLLVHKEVFQGLLAPIFCSQMEVGVPPMLNAMNKALKNIVEH